MKTVILKFLLFISLAVLVTYVTVTPIVVSRAIEQREIEATNDDFYLTHYAKGDTIDYVIIKLVNEEKDTIQK